MLFRSMYISLSAVLVMQLFMLNTNAGYYRYAGSVTKTFADALNNFSPQTKLVVDSVPQESRGALIYRLGFIESLHWLNENDSLIRWSQKNNDFILHNNYKLRQVNSLNEIPGNKLKDTLTNNSVYIKFTDSVLWMYNKN